MKIGPHSAGADPGPVCYDIGGTEPTITDANVVLGYLNPKSLVGGELKIDAQKSSNILREKIADPLELDLEQTAYGAYRIAISNMIRAIRAVSSERGRDPREYAMLAFGGNGPLFAAGMAAELQMERIIIPPSPGLFSSFGLLYADIEHHYSRTVQRVIRDMDPGQLTAVWNELEKNARVQLRKDGFENDRMQFSRAANMHYKGQIFELTIPAPSGDFDTNKIAKLEDAFGQEHERTYGHRAGPEEPVELVNAQLVGLGIPDSPRIPDQIYADSLKRKATESRKAYFGPSVGWLSTPILNRTDLKTSLTGPAIVEEYDATCLIPPNAHGELDENGNILINLVDPI